MSSLDRKRGFIPCVLNVEEAESDMSVQSVFVEPLSAISIILYICLVLTKLSVFIGFLCFVFS